MPDNYLLSKNLDTNKEESEMKRRAGERAKKRMKGKEGQGKGK
jgi:hypothetical protein